VHGSDWPIDPFDNFLALKVGVTRSGDPTNKPSAASRSSDFQERSTPSQLSSATTLLATITINAA